MLEQQMLPVPVEMAIAGCSALALADLAVWMEKGARLKPTATVHVVGRRLMASIHFETPVASEGRTSDGMALPIVTTLYDGSAGDAMLAKVKAGDLLIERLREQASGRDGL